ncbi:MAG: Apocarotenoid-15,15'-oxygenase [Cyanobacteria bacterium QH_6_48_35]|jgi:all-trans-8'-apo-beta-carotenal 15,15'-oxygenase|nr:MAG: Apocarotenoid-15,15'-oxygenase [Cyanobacteria bacterium QH_2_48_84]PSO68760.1 MAG: Apocarotenoid-15,15'-oxygenase [Cyanobacteria bacterium QH_6_48_35]PSO73039.1 MAG: Apocarotenoid-15,15'-oxygenase [Cyanobacteria bacterium QS_1_48_34]PSO86782.1 MAG: Apocarotenoid-15,15'-oxygenase [Cyanobacteria bacterium QS_5_48_63]PSO88887.1 MAG: Apocarotenoid-15,15'-oxygenase [Cyanobacteria bacterium QH_9_48_43]PSO95360.1 MAG: Apocarotenoid-15,15'-oxygenase [Cyanobacteria bacterium QS_6_48_18]PSO9783
MQNIPTQESFSAPTTPPYNQQDWQKGYESQPHEYDYWIDNIEGEIPPGLHGTFFRNGPGLLDINGMPIHHPFDGDGMVCAISFKDGKAHFRNRFVRTEGFIKEQEAGTILYRGVFGTQKPGGWLNNAFDLQPKNIANTNIIYWGGRLMALWEAAEPHRLDPYTLDTMGIDYLDGILESGDSFAAHPWVDPSSKLDGGSPCLVNFALKPGISTTLVIYELDPAGKLLRRHAHSIPGFAFIHDFAITPNYCIFFQNTVSFNPIPFVLGFRGAAECVKFQPDKPTRIVVIPRNPESGESVQFFETPSGFVFHHANAFEQGDEICIDSVCYEYFPEVEPDSDFRQVDFDALAPGQLWRFTLNLPQKTVQRQLLEPRCCEFPFAHPDQAGRPYRYLFLGAAHQHRGNAPLQAILKLDLETGKRQDWSAAPRGYVSEPIFVPKPDASAEDECWVLTMVYDAAHHRSDIVILDGQDLSEPLARLHLKHHIPYGLHGSWSDECFV